MKLLLLYCLIGGTCLVPDAVACEYGEYRIACVGDSITTGNYPKVLERLLGDNYEVKVFAHKGRSVSGLAIEELYDALTRWNPTHVVFYGGINDCLDKGPSDVFSDSENSGWIMLQFDQVIQRIQDKNVEAIIVKHHPWSGYRKKGYGCSVRVNEWLDYERFKYEGATVVETLSLGDSFGQLKKEYDAGDGLHLNYEGEKLLAQLIAGEIK